MTKWIKVALVVALLVGVVDAQHVVVVRRAAAPPAGPPFADDFAGSHTWDAAGGTWTNTAGLLVLSSSSDATHNVVAYSSSGTFEETASYDQYACIKVTAYQSSRFVGLTFCACEDYSCTPKFVYYNDSSQYVYIGEASAADSVSDLANDWQCTTFVEGDWMCVESDATTTTWAVDVWRFDGTAALPDRGSWGASCSTMGGTITACTDKGVGVMVNTVWAGTSPGMDNFSAGDQ